MTLKPKRVAPKVWTGVSKFYGENGEEIIIKEAHYQSWLEAMKDGRNKDLVQDYFNGADIKELAVKYELNDQYTRKMVQRTLMEMAEQIVAAEGIDEFIEEDVNLYQCYRKGNIIIQQYDYKWANTYTLTANDYEAGPIAPQSKEEWLAQGYEQIDMDELLDELAARPDNCVDVANKETIRMDDESSTTAVNIFKSSADRACRACGRPLTEGQGSFCDSCREVAASDINYLCTKCGKRFAAIVALKNDYKCSCCNGRLRPVD